LSGILLLFSFGCVLFSPACQNFGDSDAATTNFNSWGGTQIPLATGSDATTQHTSLQKKKARGRYVQLDFLLFAVGGYGGNSNGITKMK
jgi:hypothetical protein